MEKSIGLGEHSNDRCGILTHWRATTSRDPDRSDRKWNFTSGRGDFPSSYVQQKKIDE